MGGGSGAPRRSRSRVVRRPMPNTSSMSATMLLSDSRPDGSCVSNTIGSVPRDSAIEERGYGESVVAESTVASRRRSGERERERGRGEGIEVASEPEAPTQRFGIRRRRHGPPGVESAGDGVLPTRRSLVA